MLSYLKWKLIKNSSFKLQTPRAVITAAPALEKRSIYTGLLDYITSALGFKPSSNIRLLVPASFPARTRRSLWRWQMWFWMRVPLWWSFLSPGTMTRPIRSRLQLEFIDVVGKQLEKFQWLLMCFARFVYLMKKVRCCGRSSQPPQYNPYQSK
jgi:hypothetical protein